MRNLDVKFQQACALHQQGQLGRAQSLIEEVLARQPKHAGALSALGLIAGQTGNFARAAQLLGRAVEVDPGNAGAHNNRGLALHELGQWEAAIRSFNQAIRLQSGYALAYFNRANTQIKLEQWEAALESYDKGIAINPRSPEAYSNRGNVQGELRRWGAALESYDEAIAIRPNYAEAHFNRGNALKAMKRREAALESYGRATACKTDFADAHFNKGVVLQELEQWNAALASYDQAIAAKPDYVEAYLNRGNVFRELGQWDTALSNYDRAIAQRADYPDAHLSRAAVLQQLNRLEPALASCDRAITIKSDFAEAHLNRGAVLADLMQFEAALASWDRALAVKSDYASAHLNKSLTLLLTGHFEEGWAEHEWRFKDDSGSFTSEKRDFPEPRWLGKESIAGRTILLCAEQGFGDTLQFCRYVKWVADLGARVILEVQPPLVSLLRNLKGASQVVARGDELPAFDYWCPLMSLPLVFKSGLDTIPRADRYLTSEAARLAHWRAKLGETPTPRIGLMWSGNPGHKNDHNRSLPLADLRAHLPAEFQYVSLNKEVRELDRGALQPRGEILSVADELHDFSDTAAVCECLDLVISVDTSVAHLSGALGKPTWVLLPFHPDWRWLLERADSPWYPSVRIYRQERTGDWMSVLRRVSVDLKRTFDRSTQ